MNKNIIVGVVVAIIVLGAGAFFFMKGKSVNAPVNGVANQVVEQGGVTSAVKQGLMGMLENATGVKCSVSDATGSYTVIAKGEKARIEGMNFANPSDPTQKDERGTMINNGDWAFIWSGKEGMKFNMKEMQAANPQTAAEEPTDWRGWAAEMQNSGAKYECNPTVATDLDFTPPADVKFQDLGEMMRGFQNMQNNTQIPPMPVQ
ncbi:MAG: hypothetical protein Q7T51_03670 [Candidatus Moranbacteria bacterium]|nr:hypothetical protein [Candidatus Moranbacteria bacterium]